MHSWHKRQALTLVEQLPENYNQALAELDRIESRAYRCDDQDTDAALVIEAARILLNWLNPQISPDGPIRRTHAETDIEHPPDRANPS